MLLVEGDIHPNSLKPFFFGFAERCPQMEIAICSITREIGESPSDNGVAVFCIWRTAA
jgi:hypothetical protein